MAAPARPLLVVGLLALMMVCVPAAGARTEDLLQDTLKSILVVSFGLAAAWVGFWPRVRDKLGVRLHWILALPMMLMLHALGSMVWSHTYLGGVEAVRWFFFGLLLMVGMNTLAHRRILPTHQCVTLLAWGVHLGAVVASLWTALQFWFDWSFFAQGPAPASTFVNRNFLAEFVVCTLPWSMLLLTRLRDKTSVYLQTFALGLNVVALMMTGTRSALVGLVVLMVVLPALAVVYRRHVVSSGWHRRHVIGLVAVFVLTVLGLGRLPTTNHALIHDFGHSTALDRALSRTLSVAQAQEYRSGSFAVRTLMWRATLRMISAHPVMGVGAGAWEVEIPLYQTTSLLETDYYAHNEPLQLLAEYGLTGGLFLLLLAGYLIRTAYHTWTARSRTARREAPLRAWMLASLGVLLLVSLAGFPWRMAGTGALFALGLAMLAGSDLRLSSRRSTRRWRWHSHWRWHRAHHIAALCGLAVITGVTLHVVQQAVECEAHLVAATRIALSIQASGVPHDPFWAPHKSEMLQHVQAGIRINPHYRKITPIVADALASWGDWPNALRVWQSVLASRPNVVLLLAHVARGLLYTGDVAGATAHLDRALRIQPDAPTLSSLQVLVWSRTGREQQALQRTQTLLASGVIDPDLVQVAYTLGLQHNRADLAILALTLGIKAWPDRAIDGWLKLGDIYSSALARDTARAARAYRQALLAAHPAYRQMVLDRIPTPYRPRMKQD